MTTSIITIQFIDGRKFNIFSANKAQQNKILKWLESNVHLIIGWDITAKGIHTQKQFLTMFPIT
jgi:hypothetical protein